MKKIVISILLMSFIFNFANAEEVKQTKEVKQINKKELSEEDKLIAQFIKSNNESKELIYRDWETSDTKMQWKN